LQKYPNDPLVPRAEQRLREVQEILAEGEYRVGYFYYVRGDRRAAAGRLIPWRSATRFTANPTRRFGCWGTFLKRARRKRLHRCITRGLSRSTRCRLLFPTQSRSW